MTGGIWIQTPLGRFWLPSDSTAYAMATTSMDFDSYNIYLPGLPGGGISQEEIEAASPFMTPGAVADAMTYLNGMPSWMRRRARQSMMTHPGLDVAALSSDLYRMWKSREDDDNFWSSMFGHMLAFGLGVALGYGVGYYATAAGAWVAGNVSGVFLSSVAQLATTGVVGYTSVLVAEGLLTDWGRIPMSTSASWVMTGAYLGGILGGASYVVDQIPSVSDAVRYVVTHADYIVPTPILNAAGIVQKGVGYAYDWVSRIGSSVNFGATQMSVPYW